MFRICRGRGRGDLFVHIVVETPTRTRREEQDELFRQLARPNAARRSRPRAVVGRWSVLAAALPRSAERRWRPTDEAISVRAAGRPRCSWTIPVDPQPRRRRTATIWPVLRLRAAKRSWSVTGPGAGPDDGGRVGKTPGPARCGEPDWGATAPSSSKTGAEPALHRGVRPGQGGASRVGGPKTHRARDRSHRALDQPSARVVRWPRRPGAARPWWLDCGGWPGRPRPSAGGSGCPTSPTSLRFADLPRWASATKRRRWPNWAAHHPCARAPAWWRSDPKAAGARTNSIRDSRRSGCGLSVLRAETAAVMAGALLVVLAHRHRRCGRGCPFVMGAPSGPHAALRRHRADRARGGQLRSVDQRAAGAGHSRVYKFGRVTQLKAGSRRSIIEGARAGPGGAVGSTVGYPARKPVRATASFAASWPAKCRPSMVYRDRATVAFERHRPCSAPVHVLVVPRRHIDRRRRRARGRRRRCWPRWWWRPTRWPRRRSGERRARATGSCSTWGPTPMNSVPHLHLHVIGGSHDGPGGAPRRITE